jgi:glycosyltransferase involved in cell wall biosynthesis
LFEYKIKLKGIMAEIALVMIVKDSGEKIKNAINSAMKIASEIVVVDTGSKDNTPVYASQMGAKVFYQNWNDDFSYARNFALKHVLSDWILILDDDEELDSKNIPQDYLNDEKIGGIEVMITNKTDEGKTSSTHNYTRLFRNNKQIRFEGKIHEQIRPSIEKLDLEIVSSDLEIIHHGYTDIDENKNERNIKILEKEIEENNDDFKKYHLAVTEFAAGNTEKMLKIYEEIKDSSELSEKQHALLQLKAAQANLKHNEIDVVLDLTNNKIKNVELEGFRHYIRAAALMQVGRFAEANELYNSEEIQLSNMTDKNIIEEAKKYLKKF